MTAVRTEEAPSVATRPPLLEMTGLRIVYDDVIEAVRDVSLQVPEGAIVALLGSNGAGKSTLLKAASGILHLERGKIEKGRLRFAGQDVAGQDINGPDAASLVRAGLVQAPEGRKLFINLTVEENLTMGGYHKSPSRLAELKEIVFELFPRVAERRSSIAGYLSGGEQQMVAVGRALMAEPRLLLLDEPSLGLAPLIVDMIFDTVARMRRQFNMTILLVEQSATHAFAHADYAYILENGRVVLDGPTEKLRQNIDVQEYYLGFHDGGARKSFRDVKHYKRRKRWLS